MTSLSLWARRSGLVRTLASPYLRIRRRLAHPGRPYEEDIWSRLGTLLVEDPVIYVEGFEGTFQIDVRSHILKRLILEGVYEPGLVEVCRTFVTQGRDAVDVGANVGFFSVLLAQLLPDRRVLAAEPSRAMARRLRVNLERNGVAERVIVFEGAISDHSGEARLQGVTGKEEYGSIGVLAHPAIKGEVCRSGVETYSETVKSTTLDALIEKHELRPGIIKIDTEGAERLVFQGARTALKEFQPVIISELDDTLLRANGSSAMDVVRMMYDMDYRVLDPFTPGYPEVTREQLETPHVLTEVLCLPTSGTP